MNSLAIDIAKYLIIVPIICAFYLYWKLDNKNRRQFLILVIAGGILSIVLAKIAGKIYDDPRPFIKDGVVPLFTASHDNGFPSDHTLLASFIGFAVLFYSKRLGIALLIIAVLIGWARVYAGVHHFTDVIGSFVITGLAAWLCHWAIKKYSLPKDYHAHQDKS